MRLRYFSIFLHFIMNGNVRRRWSYLKSVPRNEFLQINLTAIRTSEPTSKRNPQRLGLKLGLELLYQCDNFNFSKEFIV